MTAHVCTITQLVDGATSTPVDELAPVMTDPDTGESLHGQRASSLVSVEDAITAAAAAHESGVWADLPVAERVAAIRRLQAELVARTEAMAIADSLDTGVPIMWTAAIIGARAGFIELAAARLEAGFGHTETETSVGGVDQWKLPWGPAAVFLPWNAPAATAVTKVADALVAGCPVIVKPSEWASHFSGPFAEAVQAAGLPAGVVQIVHGDRAVGEKLVNDRRIAAVSYTGGVAGGTAVAEACARQLKPVDLELSGNNPVVVLPDADPTTVVGQLVFGMLFLNGQACIGPRRLIVPEDQLDDYLAALAPALDAVKIGLTSDPETQLGPLAHAPHLHRIAEQVAEFEDAGCDVRRYGTLPESAGHFAQLVVILADKAPSLQAEVFGPVLLVRTYRDVDEAVEIANDHPYGLSGYVFGADRDEARTVGRRLRAGLVTVNAVLGGQSEVSPIGSAWGVSGLGTLGLGQGIDFFSGYRFVG